MKRKRVVPRALALSDVDKALDHYLTEAGKGVALRFIDSVETVFEQLGRVPRLGSPRFAHELDLPGLRSWPLHRFPYLVFYLERDDRIDVWRVLHTRRDIPVWLADAGVAGEQHGE